MRKIENRKESLLVLASLAMATLLLAPEATAQTILNGTIGLNNTGFAGERLVTGDTIFDGIGNFSGGEVDIREIVADETVVPPGQIRRGLISFDLPAAPVGNVLVDAQLSVKINLGPFMGSPDGGRDVGLRHSVTNNELFKMSTDYEDTSFTRFATWYDATDNCADVQVCSTPFGPEDVIVTDVTSQLLADYAASDGVARFRFGMEDVGTGIETIAFGGDIGGGTGNETLRLYKNEDFGVGNTPTLVLTFEPGAGQVGDYDGDLDVDGVDFLKWQRGETPGGGTPQELLDWENNFGTPSPSVANLASVVPEPSTSVLLAISGLLLLGCRKP